jgi:hypothetical protein
VLIRIVRVNDKPNLSMVVMLASSTVSPGNLELSFMYVQWSQSLTLFPMIEAGQLIALQALLAFGQHLRHRVALKRLAQDHRNALANLR